jgi:hypothetical protein
MAEEEAGMDPPFLAVPVGRLIGHDALSDAVTATWQGQCAGLEGDRGCRGRCAAGDVGGA